MGWAKAVSLWSWLGLGGLGEAGLVGPGRVGQGLAGVAGLETAVCGRWLWYSRGACGCGVRRGLYQCEPDLWPRECGVGQGCRPVGLRDGAG